MDSVLPIGDVNPRRGVPWVTLALIGLNVAVFLYAQPYDADRREQLEWNLRHALVPCEIVEGRPLTWGEWHALTQDRDTDACGTDTGVVERSFEDTVPADEPWAPGKAIYLAAITSMFLHANWLHLLGNLWYLWLFGDNVELRLGRLAFIAFYLLGGIAATVGYLVLNTRSLIPLVGASGAISAVIGAYVALYPDAKIHALTRGGRTQTSAVSFLIIYLALQGLVAVTDETVAWEAHIAGLLFGVAVAVVVRVISRGSPADTSGASRGSSSRQLIRPRPRRRRRRRRR